MVDSLVGVIEAATALMSGADASYRDVIRKRLIDLFHAIRRFDSVRRPRITYPN